MPYNNPDLSWHFRYHKYILLKKYFYSSKQKKRNKVVVPGHKDIFQTVKIKVEWRTIVVHKNEEKHWICIIRGSGGGIRLLGTFAGTFFIVAVYHYFTSDDAASAPASWSSPTLCRPWADSAVMVNWSKVWKALHGFVSLPFGLELPGKPWSETSFIMEQCELIIMYSCGRTGNYLWSNHHCPIFRSPDDCLLLC